MNNLSEYHQYLNAIFPDFEPGLKTRLAESCSIKKFKAGELIMRTGQYIKHSILIFEGRIKIYREDKEGSEVFMYYLEPGNACALSMICATRQKTSQVMAKALEDTTTLMIPVQLMDELMDTALAW